MYGILLGFEVENKIIKAWFLHGIRAAITKKISAVFSKFNMKGDKKSVVHTIDTSLPYFSQFG